MIKEWWDGDLQQYIVYAEDYDRLAAELAEKTRWQEDAVLLCAKRGCAQRDKRITDLEAELAQARAALWQIYTGAAETYDDLFYDEIAAIADKALKGTV